MYQDDLFPCIFKVTMTIYLFSPTGANIGEVARGYCRENAAHRVSEEERHFT